MKKDDEDNDPKRTIILVVVTAAVCTIMHGSVVKTFRWFSYELSKSRPHAFRRKSGSSYTTKHNKPMQEELIRRAQNAFNRERNKYSGGFESWKEHAPNQHFQTEYSYPKNDTSYKDRRTSYRETPRESGNYALSHHYSVLGLDMYRKAPYSDDEIKLAFRTKVKEYHPDQNQDNKDVAESKFKEVMTSFEAIKQENKNKSQ
ncbi:putative DnaJ domain-containing protein [Medicago truncatula]|uniref:Heat shock protein-binding protein n=1 Tax=Medicago truncatula TaxID=3880 RepID=A0A072V3F6_MEDTR|nr:uncharacterized protein LOC25490001 [Medicago truncatula]XP_024634134.1 uncharacterized protein LOC25490001 [Medicago truncatula]KEH35858.1 heat shock protein-binding protein [Medicago truncatula]RHN70407.1 putative DnaJ domain-containing protein [Medicago truncatula]